MAEDQEGFLKRWSRLKQEVKEQPPAKPAGAAALDPEAPPPELPPVEKLTMDSDFRGFFHPKVDENLRRAALKKLFSDPHFNVMDGLDVYIDDYSKPNPLPAAMLAQLRQAQKILAWAAEQKEDAKTEKPTLSAGSSSAILTGETGLPGAAPSAPDRVPAVAERTEEEQTGGSATPSGRKTEGG
jgi:uncharacterized protein DUF3306